MRYYDFFILRNPRHFDLAMAVRAGMANAGIQKAKSIDDADFGICWGMHPSHKPHIKKLQEQGKKFLIIDFPFWGRTNRHNVKEGYYKISVNGINPHDYLDAGFGGTDRAAIISAPYVMPYRKDGDYILLAGMGEKAISAFGYNWDMQAAKIMMQHTHRPIIYRAKPSNKNPQPIEGTVFNNGVGDIHALYQNAFAVVTHHGNSTIEALCAGKPVFSKCSITRDMGLTDLNKIESPIYPEGREQFMQKLAWFQWHYDEIHQGKPFEHLIKKGIL